MRIVFEDVSDELAKELVGLLSAGRVMAAAVEQQWTAARAESLLRDLPTAALEIFKVTIVGNGWGAAEHLRGEEDASLRGRSSAITRAINRGVRTGRLPEGLPIPISAQYDPNNPSFQRTKGFVMPEEHLPAFREALGRIS